MIKDSPKPEQCLSENKGAGDNYTFTMESVRVEIDAIDAQILSLLSKRMQCAQKIGAYKKEHNLPILQLERWQEILNIAIQKGHELGLSNTFVTQFLTAIHDKSIRHQTN